MFLYVKKLSVLGIYWPNMLQNALKLLFCVEIFPIGGLERVFFSKRRFRSSILPVERRGVNPPWGGFFGQYMKPLIFLVPPVEDLPSESLSVEVRILKIKLKGGYFGGKFPLCGKREFSSTQH